MRVLSVLLLFSVMAVSQTVSGRQPTVVWKRHMAPVSGSPAQDPLGPEIIMPVLKMVPVNPPIPISGIPRIAAPPPARPRAETESALGSVQVGAKRAEVVALLGAPAYSIGMPDGGHFVERCRFRTAKEDLAVIEFRDGHVTAILKM
jgi:hypothetical protein